MHLREIAVHHVLPSRHEAVELIKMFDFEEGGFDVRNRDFCRLCGCWKTLGFTPSFTDPWRDGECTEDSRSRTCSSISHLLERDVVLIDIA